MSTITIYQPSGPDGKPSHPSLSQDGFNVKAFEGQWHVVYSTLPMWKNKKDVTITYTPHTPSPLKLNDHVRFRGVKKPSSSSPTNVVGVSSLVSPPSQPTEHGAHFKWRGKGLLAIASSVWQVLGYDTEQGWAVTYFEKTLFTPAGLDIYSRNEKGLGEEMEKEIVEKVKALGGEVGKLAEGFFMVQRGDS